MVIKDISLETPLENILYDEVLLALAEQGRQDEALRFWESPRYFIVLGRIGNIDHEVNLAEAREDRVPVLRRCSGGGTVVQGKGCLNYSLILSKQKDTRLNDLRKSYHLILNKVTDVFKSLGVETMFCPISDIALAGSQKKISGNAQKRSRNYILHHGTILYDFNLPLIARYLKMPEDIPAYRGGREHLEFVANTALKAVDIKKSFRNVFEVDEDADYALGIDERRYLDSLSQQRRDETIVLSNV